MARISYQKGRLEKRKRKHGLVYVLRYRLRQGDRWVEKTEELKGCRSDKEAQIAVDKRMREVNQLNNGSGGMTVAAFVRGHWRSYVENRGYKPSTVYVYDSMIDRFILPMLGDRQIDRLVPNDLSLFFKQARQKGTGPKQMLNLYGLVRLMFGIAAEFDLIEVSPVRPKLHRPAYEQKEKTALTAAQIQRVIECADPEHRPLIVCVALTALRLGEVLALRWKDIDFERRLLNVNHNLWRGHLVAPKTKSSRRALRLPEPLADVLQAHFQNARWRGPTDWVFAREDGAPFNPNTLRERVLYPAMDRAGIARVKSAHGFHVFRHSAGSIVHGLTHDLKMAQELLGHSQISTTADIYVHLDEVMAQEASELLSRAIIPNRGLTVAQESDLVQ